MNSVRVNLGDRSYLILIKNSLLTESGEIIFSSNVGKNAVVITNTTVGALYLAPLLKSLEEALFNVDVITIPDGEQHKTLFWMEQIYGQLLSFDLDRNSPVIALGGGVLGDMAGFAAATYLRGLPLVQIPTTLLAQVDSSVGGKTGVNLPQGKNMVGAFFQPRTVLIDPLVLRTLDTRELRSGLAEVIKYSIINDQKFFSYLQTNIDKALQLDQSVLPAIIKTCCTIKAAITSQDEREGGIRAILNFGHTIGHAIETLTNYSQYRHGEAVSIGMAAAAKLSAAWGYSSADDCRQLITLLEAAGLPSRLPAFPASDYLQAIQKDKKRAGGNIRLVLMKRIGEVFLIEVPAENLVSMLESNEMKS
jgi:3-dehydroquinate synthase